jgi:hypothetical protein
MLIGHVLKVQLGSLVKFCVDVLVVVEMENKELMSFG